MNHCSTKFVKITLKLFENEKNLNLCYKNWKTNTNMSQNLLYHCEMLENPIFNSISIGVENMLIALTNYPFTNGVILCIHGRVFFLP
jgi:hypothetical protein